MTYRSLSCAFVAALCAVPGLIACSGRADDVAEVRHRSRSEALRVVHRLDCPVSQGSLQRVSADADGQSCNYAGPNGAQVTLRIMPLDGETAENALGPIEAELRAQLPIRPDATANTALEGQLDEAGQVNINLPGINIDADPDGANIRIGGLHVNADSDRASVSLDPDEAGQTTDGSDAANPVVRRQSARGDVYVDANENGAEVRVTSPGRGVRMTYILTSSQGGPTGNRFVAYEARGPSSGPLVVATLRSRDSGGLSPVSTDEGPRQDRRGASTLGRNDGLSAIKRLVRLNVGS